ncbi:MAG: FUSC family protein [Cyclobacteriaceae bacterium]|jgi:hypothetical protein|nr:FUSC family protein [Cyclobacteriaceae bacterium]
MNKKELNELTDQELLEEARKLKSFSIMNAFLIGFLVGIVIYSVVKNTFGFLMLIPLYMAYKFSNDPKEKRRKDVEALLQERKLKQ